MAVAQSSSGGVMKSQGEGTLLGVFFPIDNALYSIALGTYKNGWIDRHAVGMMSGLDRTNSVLLGGEDPQFWGKMCPTTWHH